MVSVVESLGLTASEVPEALDALIEALRANPFDKVRVASARALGRMGPAARVAVAPLIMATDDEGRDSDHDRSVQKESRDALDRIGAPKPEAVADFVVLLDHRQSWARLSAAKALGRIGPPARAAVPALASRILQESGWGGTWAEAIGLIGEASPAVVATLEEATRIRDPGLWDIPLQAAYALTALGKGRESALAYFRKKFNSRMSSVDSRIHAAEGLRRLGEEEPRVLLFLTDVVRRTADQATDPWVAQRATDVLARYGAKAGSAVTAIVRWLELKTLVSTRRSGRPCTPSTRPRHAPPQKIRPGRRAAPPTPAPLARLRAPSRSRPWSIPSAAGRWPRTGPRARARELGAVGAARPRLFALVLAAGDEPSVARPAPPPWSGWALRTPGRGRA